MTSLCACGSLRRGNHAFLASVYGKLNDSNSLEENFESAARETPEREDNQLDIDLEEGGACLSVSRSLSIVITADLWLTYLIKYIK